MDDQVDVDVDEQVRGGGPLVDLDVLALVGLAEVDQVVGVLGVVLGQQPVRSEGVVDPVAEGVAQLLLGHAPVQRERGDQHDVVDARLGRHVEHGLDHHLADVGRLHRRQRERDVVEADGELHAGAEQRRQRVAVADGVEQGVADGPVGVLDRLRSARGRRSTRLPSGSVSRVKPSPFQNSVGGVDLSTSSTKPGRRLIGQFLSAMSNAIFTAPRRPAAPAWATASSKRVSG